MNTRETVHIPEPPLSKWLFSNTRIAWMWTIVRVYIGYLWFMDGVGKVTSPAWVGEGAGTAVKGFFAGALQKTSGAHPDVSGWYAYFLEHIAGNMPVLFSYLVAYGELFIGIGLILGALTGIAAFFGLFLNFNFLFAGTVSSNPIMLLAELFLVLAWRNAGWIGLDRWLLPKLGVPWEPGELFKKK